MIPAVKHLPEVLRRLVSLHLSGRGQKASAEKKGPQVRYASLWAAPQESPFPSLDCLQCSETLTSKLGHPGEMLKVSTDA